MLTATLMRVFALGCFMPAFAWAQATAAPACSTDASTQPSTVVELYTSEGCSSCPPADRWASGLKARSDVLVLGFHVNYWDALGWRDRFATEQTTERQRQLQKASGSRYVYTPQVVLNGDDFRAWSRSPLEPMKPGPIEVKLERDAASSSLRATIESTGAQRLAGYWAVLEDGLSSRVRSGENAGETLAHDHVVTHYERTGAWAAPSLRSFTLVPPKPLAPSRRVAFVVTDEGGARPLKAAVLACR
jgi:hypothetical protein